MLSGSLLATTDGAVHRFKIIFRAGMLSSGRALACHTVGPVSHIPYLWKRKTNTESVDTKQSRGRADGILLFISPGSENPRDSSCILDVRRGCYLYVPTKAVSELLGSQGEV